MLTKKLTIVPIILDPITDKSSTAVPQQNATVPSCIIKTPSTEISFFNGVDERIIQAIDEARFYERTKYLYRLWENRYA